MFQRNVELEYEKSQNSLIENRIILWGVETTVKLSIMEYRQEYTLIRSCSRTPNPSQKSFSESRARCDMIHAKQLFVICGVDADFPSRIFHLRCF